MIINDNSAIKVHQNNKVYILLNNKGRIKQTKKEGTFKD